MRTAFKEWAVVVDALGRGEQIIILRKGGISEGRGGFKLEHERFLLFPTLFHQQRDAVIACAQRRFDDISSKFDAARVRIEFYAEVVEWRQLASLEAAQSLRGQHILRDEVIAERFERGRKKDIYAFAVRVFRLVEPRLLPLASSYAGCKSWVELEADIPTGGAQPVVSVEDFAQKVASFLRSLQSLAQFKHGP